MGFLKEDSHDRTTLVLYPWHWNKKYYKPFKYCPLCGKRLFQAKRVVPDRWRGLAG